MLVKPFLLYCKKISHAANQYRRRRTFLPAHIDKPCLANNDKESGLLCLVDPANIPFPSLLLKKDKKKGEKIKFKDVSVFVKKF